MMRHAVACNAFLMLCATAGALRDPQRPQQNQSSALAQSDLVTGDCCHSFVAWLRSECSQVTDRALDGNMDRIKGSAERFAVLHNSNIVVKEFLEEVTAIFDVEEKTEYFQNHKKESPDSISAIVAWMHEVWEYAPESTFFSKRQNRLENGTQLAIETYIGEFIDNDVFALAGAVGPAFGGYAAFDCDQTKKSLGKALVRLSDALIKSYSALQGFPSLADIAAQASGYLNLKHMMTDPEEEMDDVRSDDLDTVTSLFQQVGDDLPQMNHLDQACIEHIKSS